MRISLKDEIKKALKKEGILKEMKKLDSGLFVFYDRKHKEVVISVTALNPHLYNHFTINKENSKLKYRYDDVAEAIIEALRMMNLLHYTIYIQRQFKGW